MQTHVERLAMGVMQRLQFFHQAIFALFLIRDCFWSFWGAAAVFAVTVVFLGLGVGYAAL
jgi:hypothetical protein